MKHLISKEYYCCKIHTLFINEKQYFPPFLQENLDPLSQFYDFSKIRGTASHYKWNANDITTYSKNNVIIFFYEQNISISPFVQLPPFVSHLLNPFGEVLYLPLTKGRG